MSCGVKVSTAMWRRRFSLAVRSGDAHSVSPFRAEGQQAFKHILPLKVTT